MMHVVRLAPRQWVIFEHYTYTHPDHVPGGFQSRFKLWGQRADPVTQSVVLNDKTEGRLSDDFNFIRRHIANRRKGGFQGRIAAIFMDTHKRFHVQ